MRSMVLSRFGPVAFGFALLTASALPAQVIIDGTTATVVELGADGSVTVGIAPTTQNGVSLNRYTDFNVGPNGVVLDNQTEAARTIVNEVTSTRPSRLAGVLKVLGQTAHVIVANPNGIVIDGGRFINTGRVALTTGTVSTASSQIAPGIFQDNVTANVTQGRISVEGGGLSGQMDAIDLIAHEVSVAGLIENTNPDLNAGLRISAGKSLTTFESSVVPGNTAVTWGSIAASGESSGSVLVEILRPGVLRANRIGIEINANGAGARFAGEGYATSRQFSLRSDGQITLDGAILSGSEGVSISGASILADKTTIQSNAGTLNLNVAGPLDATDTIARAFGNVAVTAGNLTLKSVSKQSGLIAENGSLVLTTTGSLALGNLVNEGALLQGAVEIPGFTNTSGTQSNGAVTFSIAGSFRNTVSNGHVGTVLGAAGDVSLIIAKDMANERGKLLANGDLRLSAGGQISNDVTLPKGSLSPTILQQTVAGPRQWWTLWLKRRQETLISYDFGVLADPSALSAIGAVGSVFLEAEKITNQGGQIYATDGNVSLKADIVETSAIGSGRVNLRKTCVIFCSYEASGAITTHGGQISAGNSVTIEAAQRFSNLGGLVISKNNTTVTAGEVVLQALTVPYLVERPNGLYNFWRSKAAWIYLRDQFGSLIADTGSIAINSSRPVKIIGGEIVSDTAPYLQSGQDIVRAPQIISDALGFQIGWFRKLPLLWN